jgi:hypothetical protein
MATNKNQHYVPRCYLRAFTENAEGKRVNMFNIDRQSMISLAPVRHQCSKAYFYGKDERLESAIQSLEAGYADVLRRILHKEYVIAEADVVLLQRFWLFQFLRTEAASMRSVQVMNGATEAMGLSGSEYRLEIKSAVRSAMRTFAENMDIMNDMSTCLVRNESEIPFITSDDPAILTNRLYLEYLPRHGKSFGLRQSGNVTILPLTPSILFLGYDSNIYTIRDRRGWVSLKTAKDARAFNEHQFLNCRANIFFGRDSDTSEISAECSRIGGRRPSARHRIHTMIFDRQQGDHSVYRVIEPNKAQEHGEMMVHMEAVYPAPSRWPTHLAARPKGTVFTNGTAEGYLRHPRAQSGKQNEFRRKTLRIFGF